MLRLEDIEVYQMAMSIGEKVWQFVENVDSFSKNSIGYQIVRAADSISLNIAEGYGRYSFKENRRFCLYARGSLTETKSCIEKLKNREKISLEDYTEVKKELELLHYKLNAYIKSISKNIK